MTVNTDASYARQDRSFLKSFAVQRRVIGALMIREALSRYGHENLGFFWIMGEPLVLSVGVMILWTLTGATHGHGVGVIPFILTGYSMLTFWRHCVGLSVHAMRNNMGLLFHRNIRFLDILIARIWLESVGGLAAFVVAYIPLYLLGFMDLVYDPLVCLGGWFLLSWFGFGFALILAGLSELSEPVERFVQPVMYVTLPVTGAFYMVNWLPEPMQRIVVWSPLVHCFEMFRGGMFGPEVEAQWNVGYVIVCCICTTAIGLPLVREAQKHVRME